MRVPICQPACTHRAFQRFQQNENCDTHSVISEPAISRHIIVKEVPVSCPQPEQPPTFIRKYITTKTTTTHQGIPPHLLAPQLGGNGISYDHHLQHSSSSSNLPRENILLINNGASSSTQQQQKFQSSSSSQQQHVRSSSIPASQQRLNEEVFTTLNTSAPAASTTRYVTTRNYTTTNADQAQLLQQQHHQQQQIQQKTEVKSSSNQYNAVSQQQQQQQHHKRKQQTTSVSTSAPITATKTHTLPVNFSQNGSSGYQTNTTNTTPINANTMAGGRNSNSSSCIDYSNTFYNTDWKMRHGNIEKPVSSTSIPVKTTSTPTTIPIYQQHPNQSNIAYSLDGIVMQ